MRVLIIGAGGHGQVVADTLLQMQNAGTDVYPIGFLDENPSLWGKTPLDLPVLGSENKLSSFNHDAVIIAIGDNHIRKERFEALKEQGESFISACHPKAIIAPDVVIEPGCMIMAGVIVNTGSLIKENVILNTGCTVDHHSEIAAHVHVGPGCHLGGEVCVKEGALLGIGSVVMPQRTVGSWAIAGAGGLVQADVPDNTTVIGIPARSLKVK
ncbi:MAG: acetyltransferase [Candidatus Promineifilaceae bacterium]|nr:acetyltransferase [Candidatus Promineifilaceae bacterium]